MAIQKSKRRESAADEPRATAVTDPDLAAIHADQELADRIEAARNIKEAAPLLAEARRRKWPDDGRLLLPDGHPAKPRCPALQLVKITECAWKDSATARERAKHELGDWYGRFASVLELVRLDALPNVVARDYLKALRDVGSDVDRTLIAARKAVQRFHARPWHGVAGAFSKADLWAAHSQCIKLERRAARAALVIFSMSRRAERALANLRGAPRLMLRTRLASPEEVQRGIPDGAQVKDVHPQAFANAVLHNYPDARRGAAPWAYFAIGYYLSNAPVNELAWDDLRAAWSKTIKRAVTQAGG